MDYINYTIVGMIVALAGGWWMRGQSVSSIEADVAAIKQEIINLKNLFTPAPVVVAPVISAPVTPVSA